MVDDLKSLTGQGGDDFPSEEPPRWLQELLCGMRCAETGDKPCYQMDGCKDFGCDSNPTCEYASRVFWTEIRNRCLSDSGNPKSLDPSGPLNEAIELLEEIQGHIADYLLYMPPADFQREQALRALDHLKIHRDEAELLLSRYRGDV